MEWEVGDSHQLFVRYGEESGEDFLLGAARVTTGDLLTQALSLTDLPPSSSSSRKEEVISPKYATLHPAQPQEDRGGGVRLGGRPGDGMLEQLLSRPPGPSSQM